MLGPEVKSQDNKLSTNLFIKVLVTLLAKINPTQWFAVCSPSLIKEQ
jgi:hypothetical protein